MQKTWRSHLLVSYALAVLAFLYLPILILALYSFNDSRMNAVWAGFTFKWYSQLFNNRHVAEALANTLIIGFISTAVSNVAIHFGTPEQENISRMTVAEAMACVEAGYFAPGSMLPKVLAAVDFVRATGKEAIITSPENVRAAVVEGKGTHIVP